MACLFILISISDNNFTTNVHIDIITVIIIRSADQTKDLWFILKALKENTQNFLPLHMLLAQRMDPKFGIMIHPTAVVLLFFMLFRSLIFLQ
jgi:hypothetical protein